MLEQSYPVSCRACGKFLYGPVTYCPYCGILIVVVPVIKATGELRDTGQTREQVLEEASVGMASPGSPSLENQPSKKHVEPPNDTPNTDTEKILSEENKSAGSHAEPIPATTKLKDGSLPIDSPISKGNAIWGKWKWAAVAILLLVVIVVYFGIRDKPKPPPEGYAPGTGGTEKAPSPPPTPPVPTTQGDSKRETARILALEALRQGTNLSVTICNLPKFEKVLQAAKQLQAISPRYQDQVVSAESTISNARNARDQSLMAYVNKVLELGRYTPEQVSYAMDTIKNGDPAPREKIVAELLASHVNDLRNNPKPDPVKMLSNFTHRFNNFVD